MKFLLLALVAVASAQPESGADSFYGYPLASTYGYNYPVNTYAGLPTTTYAGVPTTTYGYQTAGYYNNYFGLNRFVKRDADADAEPYYPFGYAAFGQQYPFYTAQVAASEPVYKSGTYHTALRNVVQGKQAAAYGTVGQVYQPYYTNVQRYLAKRDADSDSFYPFYSTGYPTVRSTYGYGLNNLATYNLGVRTPAALNYGYNVNNVAYPQYYY